MTGSTTRQGRRHRVVTVLGHDAVPFELAVTAEVFGEERPEFGAEWYDWRLVALHADPVPTSGFTITSPYGLDELTTADTIIVVAMAESARTPELLDHLRAAHARGARMVSLCTGAFVLADAGLLDGRRATTHWMHAERLAREHPEIDVDPSVLYVDNGDVLTSAGTASSIDLCLHIVRLDHGAEIANQLARRMVVPPHRDGGQAQYVDHPIDTRPGRDLFAETLDWAVEHLSTSITVDELAERSAMSPRTFARRFVESTGTTPHQWLISQRVQAAQRMLESTDHTIEFIADACGFGTAANLRAHFQRAVHTTPSRYRDTFRLSQPA